MVGISSVTASPPTGSAAPCTHPCSLAAGDHGRFTFFDLAAVEFFADWERVASDIWPGFAPRAAVALMTRALSDLAGSWQPGATSSAEHWEATFVSCREDPLPARLTPFRAERRAFCRRHGSQPEPTADISAQLLHGTAVPARAIP